ncbi:MAG: Putative signal transduction histidine kinase [uncultured Cytophagales bacterium]|uniref:Signal transduction histidine kinase n=1 Tax=uncultured Cytophagales bacterium TaxID=158755 RepID=A0A6J4JS06_9SPHI|nr:MAG: Putative signal transduction histidine kinase [uncultured Cytophagales bacterium]
MLMMIKSLLELNQKRYKGWFRVWVHLLFWLFIFLYEAVQTSFAIKEIGFLFIGITLREVMTMMVIHYAFAYYVVPKLLLKGRWFYFLICAAAAYVFAVASFYYALYYLRLHGLTPVYVKPFSDIYLQYGFWATVADPIRMYNTILFYTTLFFTLLIKTTKSFFESSAQKINLEKEKLKLEKENMRLELNLLKSQINPHFFFNTLNNIYSLVEDKDELAASIILRLSDLMRYSLYESTHDTIPLSHELNFIQNYVELERIRHKEYVSITLRTGEIPRNLAIPPLILVTFVENAFKHGVKTTIEASWVNIDVQVNSNELAFFIQNSKPHKLSRDAFHGGIGLVNVHRRLDLLYPGRYQLLVKNEPATYTVDLKIKLHDNVPELRHSGRRAVGAGTD